MFKCEVYPKCNKRIKNHIAFRYNKRNLNPRLSVVFRLGIAAKKESIQM